MAEVAESGNGNKRPAPEITVSAPPAKRHESEFAPNPSETSEGKGEERPATGDATAKDLTEGSNTERGNEGNEVTEEDEKETAAEKLEPSARQKRFMSAQWWYYRDTFNQLQGPFYPGQMRDWLLGGWIPVSIPCAPSFHGEVPQEMLPIEKSFDAPVLENAFLAGPGVALYPPADIVEEEPEKKKEMTREELVRQLMTGRDSSLPSQNGLGMN